MASVVISGDTSGSVTLSAPAVAGTTTLTLPTVSGTVAVSGGTPSFAGITDTGNLTFTGTGNRITGDFSNATISNRVAFQTSTTNGSTNIISLPNGTSTDSSFQTFNGTDLVNGTRTTMSTSSTEGSFQVSRTGTGTYLPMTFYTGGSERARIDTSGKLLIGTSSSITTNNGESPYTQTAGVDSRWAYQVATFANSSGTQGGLYLAKSRGTSVGSYTAVQSGDSLGRIGWSGADGTNMSSQAAEITAQVDAAVSTGIVPGRLIFLTSNTSGTSTERMRIDSSGNVGIGATPYSGAKFQVTASSTDTSSYYNGARQVIQNSSATTNNFGTLSFVTANGNDAAAIWTIIGSHTAGAATGTLVFGTSNAAGAASERMRIDSSGNLLVGGSASNNKAPLTVQTAPSSSAYGQIAAFSIAASDVGNAGISVTKYDNVTTTSQIFARFLVNQGATASGQINANGASAAAFGSYSDSRLKENIVDLPSQLANIMALRPVEFDYIESEGGGHQIGFIAQEVQQVYPDLIGEREDGMLTLTDLNKNDARLIKAIQEQQALITQLQADIATLKGKA